MATPKARAKAAIQIERLCFSYAPGEPPIVRDFSISVPKGARALLVGANGVGKSTLLRLIAGRHLVPDHVIRVLGRSPFHDGGLAREIALVDGDFPVDLDIRVQELIDHRSGLEDPAREADLIRILGIQRDWRMDRVSEGQRRRVQLLMALRKPVQILLLDEVTTHLDLLVRSEFLDWLREKSEREGLTILYATHIFDGLWVKKESPWPSHLAFMTSRGLRTLAPLAEIPEIRQAIQEHSPSPLLRVCERWMKDDVENWDIFHAKT